MSGMLKEGATASVPQSQQQFLTETVSNQIAPEISTREALAIELIRELAMRKHKDELVQEVHQMMEKLTHRGIQIFLATSMRYPEYSLLNLYEDVILLQAKGDQEDENVNEDSDSNL